VIALSSASVLTGTVKAALLVKIQNEEFLHPPENEQVNVSSTDSSHTGVQPMVNPLAFLVLHPAASMDTPVPHSTFSATECGFHLYFCHFVLYMTYGLTFKTDKSGKVFTRTLLNLNTFSDL
jgi:hypothetical protein